MTKITKINPSELGESKAFVEYLEILQSQGNDILFSHSPAETYTPSIKQKKKNKDMGVRPGVPDYMIIINDDLIFIEMKRPAGGVLSEHQKQWLIRLEKCGILARVANGYDQAKIIIDYIILAQKTGGIKRAFLNTDLGVPWAPLPSLALRRKT